MNDGDLEPEIFKSAMRDAIITRLNKLTVEELTDVLGTLILKERFKQR